MEGDRIESKVTLGNADDGIRLTRINRWLKAPRVGDFAVLERRAPQMLNWLPQSNSRIDISGKAVTQHEPIYLALIFPVKNGYAPAQKRPHIESN
jgi:hypothetical protein